VADVLLGYREQLTGRRCLTTILSGVSHWQVLWALRDSSRTPESDIPVQLFAAINPAAATTEEAPVPPWRKILFETGQYNNVISLSISYQFKGRRNW